MTSCLENRAGFLFCRVLTVWYSQLLVIDSWKLSDMLVSRGQRIMRLACCFPLSFLMKGVRSRGPFHEDIFRVRRVGERTFRP